MSFGIVEVSFGAEFQGNGQGSFDQGPPTPPETGLRNCCFLIRNSSNRSKARTPKLWVHAFAGSISTVLSIALLRRQAPACPEDGLKLRLPC